MPVAVVVEPAVVMESTPSPLTFPIVHQTASGVVQPWILSVSSSSVAVVVVVVVRALVGLPPRQLRWSIMAVVAAAAAVQLVSLLTGQYGSPARSSLPVVMVSEV